MSAKLKRVAKKWITPELIENTIETWSGFLKRRVSESEAVQMLESIRGLAETLKRTLKTS